MTTNLHRYICFSVVLFAFLVFGCERDKPKVVVEEEEVKEREEEFLREELPPLEEWAEREWAEEKEEIVLGTKEGLEEAMAATSLNMRRLDRAVQKKDWGSIVESSEKIEALIAGRCVDLYYKKNPAGVPDDFILIGDQFRKTARLLVLAGKKKDVDAVKRRYDDLSLTCSDCHEKFKKRD